MSLAWHESKTTTTTTTTTQSLYLQSAFICRRDAGSWNKNEGRGGEFYGVGAIGGEIIRGSRAAERKKKTRAVNFHVCRCGKVPAE